MKKHLPIIAAVALILGALILPSCAGPAVREQSLVVEEVQGQLDQALIDLRAGQIALQDELLAPPSVDSEARTAQLEAQVGLLLAQVGDLGTALQAAVADLPAAWAEDIENAKATGGKLIGALTTGGAQGGLLSMATAALAWHLRDRRKKNGTDPLQLAHVPTPPTTEGKDPKA